MNEMYSEVRNHLRQQHAMNTQEIRGKNIDNSYKYGYYEYDGVREDMNGGASWTFSFKGKVFLFLLSVMLISCYLYGGHDLKKGAAMAWNDMNTQLTKLEEEEPAVKQAMGYVRKAYEEVKDFTKTYINIGE